MAYKVLTGPKPDRLFALTPEWRKGEIGAANGHGNARSLVRILSVISQGGKVFGLKRFLSPDTIDLIFEEQANGEDLVLKHWIRWGMGYALPGTKLPFKLPPGRVCFWGGAVSADHNRLSSSAAGQYADVVIVGRFYSHHGPGQKAHHLVRIPIG